MNGWPCSHASRIPCPVRLQPQAHTPVVSLCEKWNISLRISQPLSVQSFVWVPSSCGPSCFPSACCCARLSHDVSTTLLYTFHVVLARELLWSMIFGLPPSRVFHIITSLLASVCAQPAMRQSQGVKLLEEVECHSYTMSLLHKTHTPWGLGTLPTAQVRQQSTASPTDRWNHSDHIFNFFLTNNAV